MPRIPFPNVPKLPGVPQINRSSAFPAGPPPVLSGVIAVGRLLLALFSKPLWGIYKNDPPKVEEPDDGIPTVTVRANASPVVVPDSIREFGFKNEWVVSDYPIQEGSFTNYNKVNQPFEIQLRLTKGGSLKDRKDFLAQIEAIAGTVDLYKILTPEKTYLSCNVTRFEVSRREARGAFFLTEVDVFFREIRFVTAEYTSTAQNTQNAIDPSAKPPSNVGAVQPQPAPPTLVNRVRSWAAAHGIGG